MGYDCNCNAGCAASVSSGGSNWSPWSTYKSGAYQSYMSRGHAACGTLESSVGISDAAIAQYWNSHGSASACPIAVAVALAESSGNCGATHHNSDTHSTTDRGLWQINDYWHPECSDSCAYDCSCNAGCAVNVWQSSGWTAWATYKNGLHQKYMNDAAVACGYSAEEQALESSVQVAYNPSAAVQWADANCATDDGTECAEFASNAIKAGGHANGCFFTWVPDLDNCLRNNAGWKQTSFPCSKGSVVIWYDGQGPYHAAISRGDGTIDQHNPSRCQSSGSWGSNYCLSPPSFTATANETVMV